MLWLGRREAKLSKLKTFNEVTANRVRSARWPPRPRSEVMFEYLSRVGSSSGICTENRSSFKVQGHWDRQSLDDVSAEICRQIADDHRALKNVIPQRPFVNGGNPSTETLLLPDTSSSQQHIISIHDEPETLPPISQWYDGNRIAIHNQLSCSASTLPDSLQASLLNEPIPSKDSSICEEFSDYRQRYNLGMSKSDRRIYRKRASQEKCTRHHVQSTL